MSTRYVGVFKGTSDAHYPPDRTNALAAGIGVDSNDGYKLKYNANGTLVTLQDNSGLQQGVETFSLLNLGGTAWHTGNGQADTLSWPSPAATDIIITRVMIYTSHITTGAATLAAGTTTASKITASDNLIDDYDLTTAAPAIYSNLNKTDTEKMEKVLPTGGWITFTGSADVSGFTGGAYIYWFLA